jgi:GNAT superfamily N-acetyltransferase
MATVTLEPLAGRMPPEIAAELMARWGSTEMVTRGLVHDLTRLPGFVARDGGRLAGVVVYRLEAGACEVVSLDAMTPRRGVGSALLKAVSGAARQAGCRRVWLVTTNDNTRAMRFYQRRGWRMVALHAGAATRARSIKPAIPVTGDDGIPIEHEVEFELLLG